MMSILIPCKNEPNIQNMIATTEEEFPGSQIIIASDRDGRGKGWAMRTALGQATGDIICFIDGDMDIHPRMIRRLIPFLNDYDIVVGKKQVRGLLLRRILTVFSRIYIWLIFRINFDTQTGIKLFRRDAIGEWKTDGFMFDVEILFCAKIVGKKIIEVPVEVNIHRPMKLRSVFKCFVEALKLFFVL